MLAESTMAPIGLFIFRRPQHTRAMIQSLKECAEFAQSPVYVFCEGPRSSAEFHQVEETRSVARALLGSRATFIENERNLGLAKSIVSGVSMLCDKYGRVIVMEDDLVVGPSFLRFLNDALEKYRDDEQVMQVAGYMFDIPSLYGHDEAIFLRMASSWGWGTWKRAWDLFDIDATGWESRLRSHRARWKFDLNGRGNFWRMIRKEMRGDVSTWDIQWYYSLFVNNGMALYPPRTMVTNIGMDGSGTHYTVPAQVHQQELTNSECPKLPDRIEESIFKDKAYNAVRKMIWSSRIARAKTKTVRLTRSSPWSKLDLD